MKTRFFILMGVSGCGKTTLGTQLAARLGWDFIDSDEFHSPADVAKMSRGIPLDDRDRAPWLASLHDLISERLKQDLPGVLACSALKERYRQVLLAGNDQVGIVYLKGSYDLIHARMAARPGHYMKASMLQSQFAALEEPLDALIVDISLPVEDCLAVILENAE